MLARQRLVQTGGQPVASECVFMDKLVGMYLVKWEDG